MKDLKSKMPRVSIGMPVYNGENFIKEAIDSILAQTFEDFELIISDNASTDRTEEICRAYVAKDKRIQYIRNNINLGAAYNGNRVFELSSGKYFKWASHDDICAPTYLEKCIEVLDKRPSVILCYPCTIIIDDYGKQISQVSDDLDLRSPSPHQRYKHFMSRYSPWGMCYPVFGVIRASVLKKTPLFGNYIGSDMMLLGELALRGEFYELYDYLFYRRDHPQSFTRFTLGSNEQQTAWFDSTKRKGIYFPTWRWLYQYMSAIVRVKLNWFERMYCFIITMKWFIQNRRRFVKELSVVIRIAIRSLFVRSRLGQKLLETRRELLKRT
ncbi:MAG: glycosyltransferase family 2 protein [Candidatus Scalinduaceae bacterium]